MFRLFVDSNNGVTIYPEYDFKEDDKKIESRFRSKSGLEFVYKFGDYRQFKFGVKFVNSEFKSIVNSWWNSNTDLLFMEEGGTEVFSVHLNSKNKPINKFIRPYTTLFSGKIELGEY